MKYMEPFSEHVKAKLSLRNDIVETWRKLKGKVFANYEFKILSYIVPNEFVEYRRFFEHISVVQH